MSITMKQINRRVHDMYINCNLGRIASIYMSTASVQLVISGIKNVKDGKILLGCGKVSLGIAGLPIAIRNYLAQSVHLDRESMMAASMIDAIVSDPTASEKDRELAMSYQQIYAERHETEDSNEPAEKDD